MKVYLPGTVRTLRALLDSGELAPAPLTGFAVTPSLREWYLDDDIEALEYAALLEAARGSLRMLDEDPTVPRRRVVLAADVPDDAVAFRSDLDRAVVTVCQPVPMRSVVSAYVDNGEAEDDVRAAANAVLEADLGSADAQFVVDGAEGHDLAWYATQEIGMLVELL